jgi:hypothetical protein
MSNALQSIIIASKTVAAFIFEPIFKVCAACGIEKAVQHCGHCSLCCDCE